MQALNVRLELFLRTVTYSITTRKRHIRHLDIQYYKHSIPIHVFVFKKGEKVKTEKF